MHLEELAEATTIRIGQSLVPPGKIVRPQLIGPATGAPVLWVTDEQMESPGTLWLELSDSLPEHGLIPVILDDLESGTGRPWDSGELDPHGNPGPDDLDEAIIFRQRWNMSVPVGLLAPKDRPAIPGHRPRFTKSTKRRRPCFSTSSPRGVSGFQG